MEKFKYNKIISMLYMHIYKRIAYRVTAINRESDAIVFPFQNVFFV